MDVKTLVVRVRADAAYFRTQMAQMEGDADRAINKSRNAIESVSQLQAKAFTSYAAGSKELADTLATSMYTLRAEASNIRSVMEGVRASASASLQRMQGHRSQLRDEYARIQIEQDRISNLHQAQMDRSRVQMLRHQSRLSSLQGSMSNLDASRFGEQRVYNAASAALTGRGASLTARMGSTKESLLMNAAEIEQAKTLYQGREHALLLQEAVARQRSSRAAYARATSPFSAENLDYRMKQTRQGLAVEAEQVKGFRMDEELQARVRIANTKAQELRANGSQDEALLQEIKAQRLQQMMPIQMRQQELKQIQAARVYQRLQGQGGAYSADDIAALERQAQMSGIDASRLRQVLPLEMQRSMLKGDLNTQKTEQQRLLNEKNALEEEYRQRMSPLEDRRLQLRQQAASVKAQMQRIRSQTSLSQADVDAQLGPLREQARSIGTSMKEVDRQRHQTQAEADKAVAPLQDSLNKNRQKQTQTKTMIEENRAARGANTPEKPFQWNWQGAMFGGMAGSITGGRTGSMIGAGVGGMFGLPAGMLAAAAMVPFQMLSSFISWELGMAEKLIGGAAHVVAGLFTKSMGLALDWEKTQTSFEVMTGSPEKGRALLKGVQGLALESPFRTSELMGPAEMMLGYGIPQGSIVPSLRRLGDIAGGDSGKMRRLALAFSQVYSHNKFQGQELRQFAEAGVGADDFAKTMGVSTGTFREMMDRGEVSANVMIDTINRLTDAGGRFAGMSQRQLQTVGGSWNQLQETVEITLQKFGTGFLKGAGVTGMIQDQTTLLNYALANQSPGSIGNTVGSYFTKTPEALAGLAGSLANTAGKQAAGFAPELMQNGVEADTVLTSVSAGIAEFVLQLTALNDLFLVATQTIVHGLYTTGRVLLAIPTAGLSEGIPFIGRQLGFDTKNPLGALADAVMGDGASDFLNRRGFSITSLLTGDGFVSKDTGAGRAWDKAQDQDTVSDVVNTQDKYRMTLAKAKKDEKARKTIMQMERLGLIPGIPGNLETVEGRIQRKKEEAQKESKPLFSWLEMFGGGGGFPNFGEISPIGKIQSNLDNIGGFFGKVRGFQNVPGLMAGRVAAREFVGPQWAAGLNNNSTPDERFQRAVRAPGLIQSRGASMGDATSALMGMAALPMMLNAMQGNLEAQQFLQLEQMYRQQAPSDWRAGAAELGSVDAMDAINAATQNNNNVQIEIKQLLEFANKEHEKNQKNTERAKEALEDMRRNGTIKIIQRGG